MKNSKVMPLGKYLVSIEKHFKREGYECLGCGAFRTVFQDTKSGNVIKVPMDETGIGCNIIESELYKQYGKDGILAKCKLFYFRDIPLLEMEYVTDWQECGIPKYKLPKWVWRIDCDQVGLNSKGKMVCYDYAHDMPSILSYRTGIKLTVRY